MVTLNAIIKSINDLLVVKFPDDTVYVNLLPKDFKRPSSLIRIDDATRTDANRTTVHWIVDVSVTGFVEINGHYQSEVERLLERQDGIMELFACG